MTEPIAVQDISEEPGDRGAHSRNDRQPHDADACVGFAWPHELSGVGYIRLDRDARVTEVNAAAAALLGAEPKLIMGCALATFVAGHSTARFASDELARMACGSVEWHDLSLRTGKGTSVSATALVLADGGARGNDNTYRVLLIGLAGVALGAARLRAQQEANTIQEAELERLRLAVHALAQQLVGERWRAHQLVRSNVEQVLLPLVADLRRRAEWHDHGAFDVLERGLRQLGSGFANKLAACGFGLTSRELEVCHMLREGLSSKEIAQALSLSPQSVDVHRRNIRKKLNLTHQPQGLLDRLREIDLESDGGD